MDKIRNLVYFVQRGTACVYEITVKIISNSMKRFHSKMKLIRIVTSDSKIDFSEQISCKLWQLKCLHILLFQRCIVMRQFYFL